MHIKSSNISTFGSALGFLLCNHGSGEKRQDLDPVLIAVWTCSSLFSTWRLPPSPRWRRPTTTYPIFRSPASPSAPTSGLLSLELRIRIQLIIILHLFACQIVKTIILSKYEKECSIYAGRINIFSLDLCTLNPINKMDKTSWR